MNLYRNNSYLKIDATIIIDFENLDYAKSIHKAISPDNFQSPEGINIESRVVFGLLKMKISSTKGVGSLIATIDDLLSCVQAAEKVLEEINQN